MSIIKVFPQQKKLTGSIQVQGAKNEALQLLFVCLLSDGIIELNNVPDIEDVNQIIKFLEFIGVKVIRENRNSIKLDASGVDIEKVYTTKFESYFEKTRASLMILGPLLARIGVVRLGSTGGDRIGMRPIDAHLEAFKAFGVEILSDGSTLELSLLEITNEDRSIMLIEPSVTGTANILMLASRFEFKTVLNNAACEPYIQSLGKLLMSIGVQIIGLGTNRIEITGKANLAGAKHTVGPDFIEAAGLIALSVATKSSFKIKGITLHDLGHAIIRSYEKLGVALEGNDECIFVADRSTFKISKDRLGRTLRIYDHPWPGLSPDTLSTLIIAALHCEGTILVHQKMFESRMFFLDHLVSMGADIIICDPHRAVIVGKSNLYLQAKNLTSPDIRAGMALLIALICSNKSATISNFIQIERGYERILARLTELGVNISYL